MRLLFFLVIVALLIFAGRLLYQRLAGNASPNAPKQLEKWGEHPPHRDTEFDQRDEEGPDR